MANLLEEELKPLTKAGNELSFRPHPSTLRRRAHPGVKGIRLETITIGGRTYTSREALERFFLRLSDARSAAVPPPSSKREQQKALAAEAAKAIY